jgi:urate oxidase
MGSITAKSGALSSTLAHNAYGKSGIRLTKVTREDGKQLFKEMTVNIQLEGQFDLSYTTGDNSQIVATDSMKNTVYALAADHDLKDIESFAVLLARHFVGKYGHVKQANVHIVEDLWHRIISNGKEHAHSFVSAGNEKRVATARAGREGAETEETIDADVQSGLENLVVAKTTDSKFFGFVRDEYTTLKDADDRIFATSVEMIWHYNNMPSDFNKTYATVRQIVLDVFASHLSLAVQQTLYEIGKAVIAAVPEIEEVMVTMPNQHRLMFNLEPLGKQNKNEIFYLVDEPFGLITGTIRRGE